MDERSKKYLERFKFPYKVIGLEPYESSKIQKLSNLLSVLLVIPYHTLLAVNVILSLISNDNDVVQNLLPLTVFAENEQRNFTWLVLLFWRGEWRVVEKKYEELQQLYRNQSTYSKLIQKTLKQCRFLLKLFSVTSMMIIVVKEIEFNFGPNEIYWPVWFPFSTDYKYYGPIKFVFNVYLRFGTMFIILTSVSIDTLLPVCMIFFCGNLKILRWKIKNIGSAEQKRKEGRKSFRSLVDSIRIYQLLEEIFIILAKFGRQRMLIQYAGTLLTNTITLVITNSQRLSLADKIFFGDALLWISLQLILPSFLIENVRSESEKLTNSIFSCAWINQDRKFRKTILLFMQRSQIEFKLSVLWLTIGLKSFTQVLNFTYSLNLMLISVREYDKSE